MTTLAETSSLTKAAETILLQNEDLRRRMENLFNNVITNIEWTMRWGSPQEKAVIQRTIVGNLMKGLGSIHSKSQSMEERDAYNRLREQLAASLGQGIAD